MIFGRLVANLPVSYSDAKRVPRTDQLCIRRKQTRLLGDCLHIGSKISPLLLLRDRQVGTRFLLTSHLTLRTTPRRELVVEFQFYREEFGHPLLLSLGLWHFSREEDRVSLGLCSPLRDMMLVRFLSLGPLEGGESSSSSRCREVPMHSQNTRAATRTDLVRHILLGFPS